MIELTRKLMEKHPDGPLFRGPRNKKGFSRNGVRCRFRRLRENRTRPAPRPPLEVVFAASSEVRGSIIYATILVILVFLHDWKHTIIVLCPHAAGERRA